jgi:hypothetical protein
MIINSTITGKQAMLHIPVGLIVTWPPTPPQYTLNLFSDQLNQSLRRLSHPSLYSAVKRDPNGY